MSEPERYEWDRVLPALRQGGGAPERRLNAVLGPLLGLLPAADALALRTSLPAQVRALVHVVAPGAALEDTEAFYAAVARRAGLPAGAARELAQQVLAAVGRGLAAEERQRIGRHLPDPLAELLSGIERPVPEEVEPEVTGTLPPRGRSLAAGRPGSAHPLSEARPGSAHPLSEARPERAHQHSVARAAEPHADTKISSSRGLTQEREHETLAEGHPPVDQ